MTTFFKPDLTFVPITSKLILSFVMVQQNLNLHCKKLSSISGWLFARDMDSFWSLGISRKLPSGKLRNSYSHCWLIVYTQYAKLQGWELCVFQPCISLLVVGNDQIILTKRPPNGEQISAFPYLAPLMNTSRHLASKHIRLVSTEL